MRLHRPFTATAARKTRASRTPCGHPKWCPHGVSDSRVLRAAGAAIGRFNHIIAQRFANAAQ
eukprot:4728616-Lingulodinium_polyedra.AAC.1